MGRALNGLASPFRFFVGKMEHSKNVKEFMGTSGQVRRLYRDLGRERLKDHSQVLGKRMWVAHRHVCVQSVEIPRRM